MKVADNIADEFVTHAVDMQRYSESVYTKVVNFLTELELEMEALLDEANLSKLTQVKERRLNRLLRDVRDLINTKYKSISKHVAEQMKEAAYVEAQATAKIINTALGTKIFSSNLTQEFLGALATDALISGATNKDWWSRHGQKLTQQFSDQIRMGIALNESREEIISRVRGTSTGKVRRYTGKDGKTRDKTEFAGGILTPTRRLAKTLILTSLSAASAKAREALYEENDELIKGKQALATLDSRTSEICRARSGLAWDLNNKPMKGTTKPFPGPPPWHWRCRTVLIPILKEWNELDPSLTKKNKIGKNQQASMDGNVAADLNYEDWLKTKPAEFQEEVLGKGKYELWKKNKLALSDMLDQAGNPLTLKKLKKKYK